MEGTDRRIRHMSGSLKATWQLRHGPPSVKPCSSTDNPSLSSSVPSLESSQDSRLATAMLLQKAETPNPTQRHAGEGGFVTRQAYQLYIRHPIGPELLEDADVGRACCSPPPHLQFECCKRKDIQRRRKRELGQYAWTLRRGL